MYRFDDDEHSQTLAIALVRERVTAEVWRPAREAVGVVCGAGDEQARGRAEELDRCADRFAQIAATTPAGRPAALDDSLSAGIAVMVDLYELAGRLRRGPRDAAATAIATRVRDALDVQIARDPAGKSDEYLAMLERVDGGYEHLPARNLARTYPGMAALRESVVAELVHLGALATRSARPLRPPPRVPGAAVPPGPVRAGGAGTRRDAAADRRDPGRARRPDRAEDGQGVREVADQPPHRPPPPRRAQHAEPAAVAPHGLHRQPRHRQDHRRAAGGRIFGALGLLAKGHLVEVDRSDLVAEYVGQTAPQIDRVVDRALGRRAVHRRGLRAGAGAAATTSARGDRSLLKRMEDDRERFVVIVAGYPDEMARSIGSNPGLASRFNETRRLPGLHARTSWSAILRQMVEKGGYVLSDGARKRAREVLSALHDARDRSFGNARTARNLFEDAVLAHADRVAGKADLSDRELELIEASDIDRAAEAALRTEAAR